MAVLQDRFIANVNAILDDAGISRAELARRMDVTQPIPGKYLNGLHCPGLDILEKFAVALDLPDPTLLLDEDLEHVLEVSRKHRRADRKVAVAG